MKKGRIILLASALAFCQSAFAGKDDKVFDAIKKHDKAALEAAFASGANANATDKNGEPALNSAAMWPDLTQVFVDNGADVNKVGKTGMSPLMTAAAMSSPESVDILLKAGANVNYKMSNGMTTLHFATWRSNCAACVEKLIKGGADINAKDGAGETPLTIMMTASSAEDRLKTVHYTTNAYKAGGFTVMPERFTNPQLSDYDDPDKIVEVLIKNGADPNAANKSGTTPLITAAFFNKTDLMKLLIEAGADPKAKDRMGVSALSYAARRGSKDAMFYLIDKGVDVNETFTEFDEKNGANVKDFTMLSYAVMKNQPDVVEALLEKGARADISVHGRFRDYKTGCMVMLKEKRPLFFAIETGNLELVKLLVESGQIKPRDPNYIMVVDQKMKKDEMDAGSVTITKITCTEDGIYLPKGYAKKLGMTEIHAYLDEKGY